jgi:hypothetical protein
MQHAPVVDYQGIAPTNERNRQRGTFCKPVTNLGRGGVSNFARRSKKDFIPSQEIGALRRTFEQANKRNGSIAGPAWLEYCACESIPRNGVDECAAIDQQCRNVIISNQAS